MEKQVVQFFSQENDFFRYVLVIIGIYFAQTFFKVSAARKKKTFSWSELINGMIDYLIYFVGIIIFFFAGTLVPDKALINFADKTYTITDALTILAYGLMGTQAYKCFKNIQETFNIADDDIPKKVDLKDINDNGMRG